MQYGETVKIAVALFGGLGLFLYGMTVMSEGLEKVAGPKMKHFIEILTTNRLMGVIVGAFVTMIVQSSSATTVMVVGFVNAGIMNLTQAIAVIMGANVGTTITAQLVAFKLTAVAPIAIGSGVCLKLFTKDRSLNRYSEILLGFGLLFLGMDTMKIAMKPLREVPAFIDLLTHFGDGDLFHMLMAILTGFGVTAIVQSSSATTAIMVALASAGLLPIDAAFPVLLGTNIGTCVTALISSVGANKTAKRAAIMHMLFNVTGTLIFAFILAKPALWFVKELWITPERQLAMMHTLFNVGTTIILVGFAPWIVFAAEKIIPITEDEDDTRKVTKYLDERLLETPSIAFVQVSKEILHMGHFAYDSLKLSGQALLEGDSKKAHQVFDIEKKINNLEEGIVDYLVKLSNEDISSRERVILDGFFNTVNDIERIGDHADNIAELCISRLDDNAVFSDGATKELNSMISDCMAAFSKALDALHSYDVVSAHSVIEMESYIDMLEKKLRKQHIQRLRDGLCDITASVIYLDVISNLERVGDHASNIALAVLDTVEENNRS